MKIKEEYILQETLKFEFLVQEDIVIEYLKKSQFMHCDVRNCKLIAVFKVDIHFQYNDIQFITYACSEHKEMLGEIR